VILVTGGAGFIGTNFVRAAVARGEEVLVVDRLGYAAQTTHLEDLGPRVRLVVLDLASPGEDLARLLAEARPWAIVHCAAETHVDRSILGPEAFVASNLVGTFRLLEAVRVYWAGLAVEERATFRLLHVSTDEVYGSRAEGEPPNCEGDPYDPTSPYAATKAGSDHLARAWQRTYGLPVLVTNCTNNYGPYQHPEKFLPLMIHQALRGRPLPVYGDGRQVRDWLYVEDHVRALFRVLEAGTLGATYHVSAGLGPTNLEVLERLCAILDRLRPRPQGPYFSLVRHVADRPAHDRRYALSSERLRRELGWRPEESLESGLEKTVRWYLAHEDWWARAAGEDFRRWLAARYDPEVVR
jgi:dTDP-glucose 4,6-dehydratase